MSFWVGSINFRYVMVTGMVGDSESLFVKRENFRFTYIQICNAWHGVDVSWRKMETDFYPEE